MIKIDANGWPRMGGSSQLPKFLGLALATLLACFLAISGHEALGDDWRVKTQGRWQSAKGIASFYGGGENLNRLTASGEVFDPEALTAASWHYPFGQRLRVTNLESGESVIVRVTDRGPHKRLGRLIDLSRGSFRKICPLEKGLVGVKVEEVE